MTTRIVGCVLGLCLPIIASISQERLRMNKIARKYPSNKQLWNTCPEAIVDWQLPWQYKKDLSCSTQAYLRQSCFRECVREYQHCSMRCKIFTISFPHSDSLCQALPASRLNKTACSRESPIIQYKICSSSQPTHYFQHRTSTRDTCNNHTQSPYINLYNHKNRLSRIAYAQCHSPYRTTSPTSRKSTTTTCRTMREGKSMAES